MRALEAIGGFFDKLAALAARKRGSEPVCGQCERWERCGLPPNRNCIVMAAQVARDEGRSVRQAWLT
jgi:hypothetical protein